MEGEVFGMPLIIFKPRQYKRSFVKNENGSPSNGPVADPPNDRDLKICEISRFEGWTTQCFCDTGEFEVTTRDVDPAHISTDNVVFFEDRLFVIETIKWERDAEGYVCTFGGRDMWKYMESYNTKPGTYIGLGNRIITYATNIFKPYRPPYCGWYSDADRKGDLMHLDRLGNVTRDDYLAESAERVKVPDVMSNRSLTRYFMGLTGFGLEFGARYNSTTGLFEHMIKPTHYSDNVVTFDASDRGISNFSYIHDERNVTNATLLAYENGPYIVNNNERRGRYRYYSEIISSDVGETAGNHKDWIYHCKKGSAMSYAEIGNKYSERVISCQSIPSDVDTRTKFADWINNQMTTDYQGAEDSVSFDYDNQGRYRFGRDFFLGDFVKITDGFLGVKSKQKLIKVKREYKAGSVVSYSFEFGSEKTTQADKLKTKFREIDRRTFGITGLGA